MDKDLKKDIINQSNESLNIFREISSLVLTK